jgi:hypothetical protein
VRNQAVRQVSKVTTRPATVKGLNAFDSIVAMPEGFALVLRNLYAQPFGCQMRRGYHLHVGDFNGSVETLASHNAVTRALYAWVKESTESVMYDVTQQNVAVSKLAGLSNARWQHINFANAAGPHLVAVNGADDMIWVQPNGSIVTVGAGDGTGNTISGVDPKVLIQVYSHQKRLWFVEKNSTRAWYLPPDQITGVAHSFDFGPLWADGGQLAQIITWTIDDGDGADDHLMAISNEGQVAVYKGTDPDGADTWGLQGVYLCGAPASGNRFACRYGGDVLAVTQFGAVYMSDLLKSTKVNPNQDNSAKYVQQLISGAVSINGDMFGWQPFIFPGANMLMVNAPATETTSYQLVMNDITKAWSEFIGYNAYCWELHQQLPFYGSYGAVYRAWEGTTDGAYYDEDAGQEVLGSDVLAEVQSTFSYFDTFGQQKHFKMVRPTIVSRGAFSLSFSVNADFVFDSPLAPAAFLIPKLGRWNEDLWNQAVWEGGLMTFKNWQSVNSNLGTAGSLRMLIRSSQETYWPSTDWLYEVGGVM